MDLKLFSELWREGHPDQWQVEWLAFLEFVEAYFLNRGIFHPLVVEIGVYYNMQKKFYEKLLKAKHIGIDISNKFATPDILGNCHDPETLKKLKQALDNHFIELLFIDGHHSFESAKKDYEIYGNLTSHLIAFHDIGLLQVEKFWNELSATTHEQTKITIYRKGRLDRGIGLIIKERGNT